jgi:hypothetical protein
MPQPRRRDGARRALRTRTLPQWLRHGQTTHPIARARALLLLRVLSGAEPLTQALATAKVSRPTYYWLERKGLRGMLLALTPMPPRGRPPRMAAPAAQVATLERKVQQLEQAKRRAERLLMVTRTVLPRLRRRRRSTPSGRTPLRGSTPARIPARRPSSRGLGLNETAPASS